jgi:hypothetical protein
MDGRRGQESNLPRFLRTDDGFEDREGHQAPFTLRCKEENAQRSSSNIQRPTLDLEGVRAVGAQIFGTRQRVSLQERLFCFFDRADDGVEIRPIAGVELGMEQLIIGANFESTATRGNESKRLDPLAEFENFGRQTDSLGRVVSNHAVFDRYFGFHFELLSKSKRTEASIDGQASRRDRKVDRAVPCPPIGRTRPPGERPIHLSILTQQTFVES